MFTAPVAVLYKNISRREINMVNHRAKRLDPPVSPKGTNISNQYR